MDLIKNYIYPFILTIFLGCIFSIVHAEEKLQATAYLCLDNEVILPSKTLQERINSTKQFLANTTLLLLMENYYFSEHSTEMKDYSLVPPLII